MSRGPRRTALSGTAAIPINLGVGIFRNKTVTTYVLPRKAWGLEIGCQEALVNLFFYGETSVLSNGGSAGGANNGPYGTKERSSFQEIGDIHFSACIAHNGAQAVSFVCLMYLRTCLPRPATCDNVGLCVCLARVYTFFFTQQCVVSHRRMA